MASLSDDGDRLPLTQDGEGAGLERAERPTGSFLRASPEEREHYANVLRLRVAMALGAVIWPSFATMDWLMCQHVYPGADFMTVLLIRLAATPLQLAFLYRLRQRPTPSARAILWFDATTFVWGSASLGMLAAMMGGIGGPYTAGVFIVLICRNAFLVQPWRRSVVPNLLIVLSHFFALFVAEWLQAGSVFTEGTTPSLALMWLHFSSLACGAVMLTAAANTTWALRRRVFEARNLGRYRLQTRIAEGGHGEVWRAFHPGMRQDVAIKVLRSDISDDPRALVRFEREIDALCKLRHPHTIRILDYGVTTDGVGYYAMELLEGVTLAQLVHQEGVLDAARAIHLALQVTGALSEAHQHGIVHRDVKPENVFVLSSESVNDFAKLLDFGVARLDASLPQGGHLTRTGVAVGTPAFMAPEVAAGERADLRADVYGVGTLIAFMLTGRPPSARAVFDTDTPPDLKHVVDKCLSPHPEGRYADAAALSAALSALRDAHVFRPLPKIAGAIPHPTQVDPTRSTPRRER